MSKFFLYLLLFISISTSNIFAQTTKEKETSFHSSYILERSLNTQIGTFKSLNETLKSHDLKTDASALYFNFGVGYSTYYKQFSLATIGRYGINLMKLNQHTLDWNILQLSYHFNVNPKVQLAPKIGYGIMSVPMNIKLNNNNSNTINNLTNNGNSIRVVDTWDYFNVGLAITPRKNKSMAIGISYAVSLSKSNWRNNKTILNDVASTSMNSVSLYFSYLL